MKWDNGLSYDPLADGKSLIEYVDHMGNDSSVVRSARVSYQGDLPKDIRDLEISKMREYEFDPVRDAKLVRYLADNDHGTPFENTAITLHVSAPIFVIRQWHRHRVGVSYNEVSRRYTSENIEFYFPKSLRYQNTSGNRQSSYESDEKEQRVFLQRLETVTESALLAYEEMIESSIAREQARMILPQSLYTRMYVTGNLRSFAHFYRLRADDHAQYEIRVYAEALGKIIGKLYPVSWSALTEDV